MISTKLLLALVPGVLSTRVLIFPEPGCQGQSYSIFVPGNTCLNSLPAFKSYMEDGYGSKGERIAFYDSTGCNGFIYDTWSYGGDYFQSKKCYTLRDHASNGQSTGLSIGQKS
ncbi:hypothetical protein CC80DRAFT_533330 [Byssothecium circinans]|uniref:Uncharacterized protein n=1 Tax=Byssothecium circinans TaxID=147558 RepID=A0A6A5U450_9PLEO|nr:hypothetical protein CC80DRAFT_533330 [Byssothecium circinans]